MVRTADFRSANEGSIPFPVTHYKMEDSFGNQLAVKDVIVFAHSSVLTPGVVTEITQSTVANRETATVKYPAGTRTMRRNPPYGILRKHVSLHTLKLYSDYDMCLKIHPAQIKTYLVSKPYWLRNDPDRAQLSAEVMEKLMELVR